MSSGFELLVDEIDGRLHAAVIQKTVLHNLYVDDIDKTGRWASLYLGKVTKIDKRLNAAIIDLGAGLSGMLAAKHAITRDTNPPVAPHDIADALSPGQMVLVQIKSEGKRASHNEGHKMPRLTMKLHIMGQYLHHTPVTPHIQNADISPVSSWLSDKGGWVLRKPAIKTDIEKIKTEALNLLREWQDIRALAAGSQEPRLLKAGPNALEAMLNDYGADMFDHIYVSNRACLDRMINWCEMHDAALAGSKRLKLFKPEKPGQRLFDIHEVYGGIEGLAENRIELSEGGSIVIETTTALTVIDVNHGNSNDSIVGVNLRAADEIVKQIRLRNLSGAILVDFIGMGQKSDRLKVYTRLETLLALDSIKSQVHGYTRLGIIEITRKRRKPAYAETVKTSI